MAWLFEEAENLSSINLGCISIVLTELIGKDLVLNHRPSGMMASGDSDDLSPILSCVIQLPYLLTPEGLEKAMG